MTSASCHVRPERPDDFDAVRRVNLAVFGQDGEGGLVDALREGGFAAVSLVAELEADGSLTSDSNMTGQIVGHILFSDMAIVAGNARVPALALAPMAVVPEYQRQGIGSALVEAGLAAARDAGHRIMLVVGHVEYYPRFGFSTELARPIDSPYAGEAFMALELVAGALDGVTGAVDYAAPFNELG